MSMFLRIAPLFLGDRSRPTRRIPVYQTSRFGFGRRAAERGVLLPRGFRDGL